MTFRSLTAMKYKIISIADSKNLIKESKPMILDCRDLKDYRAGHLEDALHVHEGLKDIVSSNAATSSAVC